MSSEAFWGRTFQKGSQVQRPFEVGACLECLRNSKGTSVIGVGGAKWKEKG